MSSEEVKVIIGRAVTEPEYRELLFGDIDKALEGFDLSDEEISSLKELIREKFDNISNRLEERISKSGFFSLVDFKAEIDSIEFKLDNLIFMDGKGNDILFGGR